MSCQACNPGLTRTIKNYMQNKTPEVKDRFAGGAVTKAVYNQGTLINNWYEDRCLGDDIPEQPREMLTEYGDEYREICNTSFPERRELYEMIFTSMGKGRQLLTDHHGTSYFNNFTSTYDLCYEHLPRGICGPFPRHYDRTSSSYIPAQDLCKIYGNLSSRDLEPQPTGEPEEPLPMMTDYSINYCPFTPEEILKWNQVPEEGVCKPRATRSAPLSEEECRSRRNEWRRLQMEESARHECRMEELRASPEH